MPGCCAVGCTNRTEKGFQMFVFPSEPERRKRWEIAVGRCDTSRPSGRSLWEATKYSRLCKQHFQDSAFENRREDGKMKLRRNAVPTVFHHRRPVIPRPKRRRTMADEASLGAPGPSGCKEHNYAASSTSTDLLQPPVIKEKMLPEQQELNLSVDQKQTKRQQEEVRTSDEGQQLMEKNTKFCFVPVKTEHEDEKPESSQVLQNSDMEQQTAIKEEMLPEQQELNQKDIKQQQEDVWTSDEEQQLHRVETEKKTTFCFVPLKTEHEEKRQSSQVLQNSDMQTLLVIHPSRHSSIFFHLFSGSWGQQSKQNFLICTNLLQPLQGGSKAFPGQLVMKGEILPEQQERKLSVENKEEEAKLCRSPQVQQLHQLEEVDITKISLTSVKSENNEKPQTSQVLRSQSCESKEAGPGTRSSSGLRTLTRQAGGEDDGGPQPASCSRLHQMGRYVDDHVRPTRHVVQRLSSSDTQDLRQRRRTKSRPSSLQMETTRSSPGGGRGKRCFPSANRRTAKKPRPFELDFYLLPKQCEKTPKEQEKMVHLQAGLGRRTTRVHESTTREELCDALQDLFPKLGTVTGGWQLYKCSGGGGSQPLSLVAPEGVAIQD